jgi:NADPH:quinone reductase-like Zn-dependent oxidoreductase
MKAVVIDRYGSADTLQYQDRPNPTPQANEVLVRVQAVGLNPIDWKVRQGEFRLLPFAKGLPRIAGSDFAGEVVEVGQQVTEYGVGDRVYGSINPLQGGACAEYVAVSVGTIAHRPNALSAEEAAAIPIAGITALMAIRDKAQVRSGQHVLINGAAGGVGTFAVQIAKSMGATVTGVCSQQNFELVQALGADHLVDYTQQDFVTLGTHYDAIFDAAGKRTFSECRKALTSAGHYIITLPNPDVVFWSPVTALLPGQKCHIVLAQVATADLVAFNNLVNQGKLRVVIDRTYPLAETSAAHRYSETGHAAGKIILTVP